MLSGVQDSNGCAGLGFEATTRFSITMTGRIPENILEDILSRVDIVALVADSVSLKKAGRNFKACCPFHHEKTASFIVSPDKQIYHCFGCGESGNAFKFLMRHERMEFREAVEYLAKKAGVTLPNVTESEKRGADAQANLTVILDAAAEYYAQVLKSAQGANARQYLQKRGINAQTIDLLKIGYAPDGWDALLRHLQSKQFTIAVIEKAGLIMPKDSGGYYDRFRNRLLFPIRDVRQRTIAFGGRVLDQSLPKYINSPETPVYTKGRNFYGLNISKEGIRDADAVAVVEGYLDFIVPYQYGYHPIVASLGTALTHEQARLLKRYTQNVVMVYDADDAGQSASVRSLDIFVEEEMNVRIASLPAGHDPDTFVRDNGVEAFKELVAQAVDLFDFKLKMMRKSHPGSDIHSKAKIATLMLETIGKIKHAVVKSEYIKKLAHELRVSEDALMQEVRKVRTQPLNSETAPVVMPTERKTPVNATEKLLLRLMLEEGTVVNRIKEHFAPDDFQDKRVARIMAELFERCADGRKTDTAAMLKHLGDDDLSAVVCESALEGEDFSEEHKEKIIEDCIRRLKSTRLKVRRECLHQKIKDAQADGDEDVMRSLMAEFNELTRTKSVDK
jgi:DNA primase